MEQLHSAEPAEMLKELNGAQPTVIGVEGGPCGGKTTLINSIVESAYLANRNVVVLDEVATKHITKLTEQGIDFFDMLQNNRQAFLEVEVAILGDIISTIEQAKQTYAGTNTIIIADRASIKAYVSAEEHNWILEQLGRVQAPHLDLVDTMVFLPSVARENAELYEQLKATNDARYEPASVAQAVCEANFDAIKDHPELHVFWGGTFTDKIREATEIITHPEREIEPKFMPTNTAAFESYLESIVGTDDFITTTYIEQSYHVVDDVEARLRKVTTLAGESVYFCSFKEPVSPTEKTERRHTITEKEYELLTAAPSIGAVQKLRHSFFVTDPTTGKRLVWVADEYQKETGRFWNIEVELPTADMLENLYFPVRLQQVEYSARDLAIAQAG
ncbi:MAG: AAA family ATPase [Candidatus Saccharimonadales bacterium]